MLGARVAAAICVAAGLLAVALTGLAGLPSPWAIPLALLLIGGLGAAGIACLRALERRGDRARAAGYARQHTERGRP